MDEPLLSVRDLRIAFDGVEAVRGLSFDVSDGEVFALVGESGAGKSLTARALLGMAPREATVSGDVRLRGHDGASMRALWGRRVAFVPQDSLSALSPVHPVGDQLAAAVRSVRRGLSRRDARALAADALDRVGIPADRARAYPHELSGGMRQRAVIAMATINAPELVVADEPTTALDPDLRHQVLRLLAEQREATGAALVLVTHDLDVVRDHADRLLVMYAGRHAESGPVREVFARPHAPYTAGLLASLPPESPPGATPEVSPLRKGTAGTTAGTTADATVVAPTTPEARAETAAGTTHEPPAEADAPTTPEARAKTPAGTTPETPAESDAPTTPEARAKTPARTTPKTPAGTTPEAPAGNPTETPAGNPTETPAVAPRETPHRAMPDATPDATGEAPAEGPARRRRLPAIGGTPPAPGELPDGCAFAPRCPLADDRCRTELPEPGAAGDAARQVSCHHWARLPASPAELFLEHV
ncbi:ABC transporter ATP-binding protein [Streptomyces sp. TRM64462]|uniref:ABC transporter ATP-binding protein n=1 Tax=Streptomyces sp. TRM64462 TaxID=2741726 RepID=UPI002676AE60|nr:oligopeptide/dipeptide ABC transporter ATP-binding protein [Streptomyces sp. TRM64462]